MSFDGLFLNRILKEIYFLKTGRISKILESGDTDFILTIRANRENYNLMLSFSSEYSRIHITKKAYDSISNPKSFTMFLRKHIEGYFIEDIKQYENDRIIIFELVGHNELEDLCKNKLICEIMGRYSNLILTDENYRIIDSLKHDGVGEYNRTILPNALYEYPKSDKINPIGLNYQDIENIANEKKLNTPKDYLNTFLGLSMHIIDNAFINDNINKNLYDYINSDTLPIIFKNKKGKPDFYFNPLNEEITKQFDSVSQLLDYYYYQEDLKAKIKLKTNDLSNFINKQIKKYENKLEKLESERIEALDNEHYRIKGELLLSYPNLKEKSNKVEVYDYYNLKNIIINLDPKFTILENSNRYFKKYQKMKASLNYISEQEEITKNEIDYFKILKYQISDCSINEALEIQDELINNKYLFKHVDNKPKKKQKPKLLTYVLNNGTEITVGKNNIQNEYLTHKLALPNEMWFHIKGGEGSHVVVHNSNELTEEEIRIASMLAAYYSTFKNSSSVPVDYTRVKFIKKIPGKRNCFVTYTHQHTIYIDPDINIIEKLKVKK